MKNNHPPHTVAYISKGGKNARILMRSYLPSSMSDPRKQGHTQNAYLPLSPFRGDQGIIVVGTRESVAQPPRNTRRSPTRRPPEGPRRPHRGPPEPSRRAAGAPPRFFQCTCEFTPENRSSIAVYFIRLFLNNGFPSLEAQRQSGSV